MRRPFGQRHTPAKVDKPQASRSGDWTTELTRGNAQLVPQNAVEAGPACVWTAGRIRSPELQKQNLLVLAGPAALSRPAPPTPEGLRHAVSVSYCRQEHVRGVTV